MSNWTDIIQAYRASDHRSVLVTVGAISGSTPRETGAKMLVTRDDTIGTIGGGQLEFLATRHAREKLRSTEEYASEILKLPLGPELAQCCGGHVDILLTPLGTEDDVWMTSVEENQNSTNSVLLTNWNNGKATRSVLKDPMTVHSIDPALLSAMKDVIHSRKPTVLSKDKSSEHFTLIEPTHEALFHLTLFGAGHVGKAVINTLSQLPCTITWVDERADIFPNIITENVQKIVAASPAHHVAEAPTNSFFLVMTHSHQLDLDICAEILKRGDSVYLGLIGSKTKRQKFLKRLALRGFEKGQLTNLTCPIGLENLEGKHPAQIAISVSAEILGRLQSQKQTIKETEQTGISLHN